MKLLLLLRIVLFHALFFCSFPVFADPIAADPIAGNSLDASVEESALRTLTRHRPHTGSLYRAILPPSLAGMEVSLVRLRTKTLWRNGTNFSHFSIPSRTVPVPHVKRLLIVYQNLGNWSSQYYAVPGYSLATSIVGFSVYDASNASSPGVKRIVLDTMGRPISVHFHDLKSSRGQRCASFTANGTVLFSEMRLLNTCFAQDQGRFAIVVPLESGRKEEGRLWAVCVVLGFVGVIVGFYLVMVLCRLSKSKKVQVMEKEADEGELFGTVWVAGSKMPSATVTRTQPTLENGGFA